MSMKGKVALVTGGRSGIGLAIAQKLSADGARIFTAQRRADTVFEGIEADFADPASAQRVVSTVIDQAGRLDVLINNAGVMEEALVEEMSLEAWNRTLAVNLSTPFMSQACRLRGVQGGAQRADACRCHRPWRGGNQVQRRCAGLDRHGPQHRVHCFASGSGRIQAADCEDPSDRPHRHPKRGGQFGRVAGVGRDGVRYGSGQDLGRRTDSKAQPALINLRQRAQSQRWSYLLGCRIIRFAEKPIPE